MRTEFADRGNQEIYVEWTRALRPVFGDRMSLHYDLYELTHTHRIEHDRQSGEGTCTAWPSPPYRAPMWPMVVASVKPTRFLEVGCGLGYTAALMADAGGPQACVDTIESDPLHADLAEKELSRRGLADRVRVLRGDENAIIPTLTRTYDVVFVDRGRRESEDWPKLKRLTRQGGVRISKQVMSDEVGRIVARLVESGAQGEQRVQRAYAEAEKGYREAVGKSMTVR